jgi:hypothetical protein
VQAELEAASPLEVHAPASKFSGRPSVGYDEGDSFDASARTFDEDPKTSSPSARAPAFGHPSAGGDGEDSPESSVILPNPPQYTSDGHVGGGSNDGGASGSDAGGYGVDGYADGGGADGAGYMDVDAGASGAASDDGSGSGEDEDITTNGGGGGGGGGGYLDVDPAPSHPASGAAVGVEPAGAVDGDGWRVRSDLRPNTASSTSGRFTTGGSNSSERLLASPNRSMRSAEFDEVPPTVCGFSVYTILQVNSLFYALIKAGFDFANTVGGRLCRFRIRFVFCAFVWFES